MRYADQFTGGTSHVKETLRTIVVARARSGKTILYSELGERVGRPGQGPWPELDVIADEELAAARHDPTLVVIRRDTGYPARFHGKPFNPNNAGDVEQYTGELKALFEFYRHPAPTKAGPRP